MFDLDNYSFSKTNAYRSPYKKRMHIDDHIKNLLHYNNIGQIKYNKADGIFIISLKFRKTTAQYSQVMDFEGIVEKTMNVMIR